MDTRKFSLDPYKFGDILRLDHVLNLNNVHIADKLADEIGIYLDQHHEITKLTLVGCKLNARVFEKVAQHGKNLTTLDLSFADAVDDFQGFSHLKSLQISELNLFKFGSFNLHDLYKNFDKKNYIDDSPVWETLKTFSNLKKLDLGCLRLIENTGALNAIASLKQLTNLRMKNTKIFFNELKNLLTSLTELTAFEIDALYMPEQIRELTPLTKLEYLKLTIFNMEGVLAVADTFPNLKKLDSKPFICTYESIAKIQKIEKDRNMDLSKCIYQQDVIDLLNQHKQNIFTSPEIANTLPKGEKEHSNISTNNFKKN